MARNALIEKENRTTITGIIAIVLIVFLIASFMRVNQIGFFAEENTVGMAVNPETFLGIRQVHMTSHEVLIGHLSLQGLGTRTYYVYPEDGILLVDYGASYVQTVLVEDDRAPGIYRAVYNDRLTTRVLVNTLTAQLYIDDLTTTPLAPISLTESKVFDGEISVAGENHYFRLSGDELFITTPDGQETVRLVADGPLAVGTWMDREITVNPVERTITVNNLY